VPGGRDVARIDMVALGGDGVGPEVTEALLVALEALAERYGHELDVTRCDLGWAAYEAHGVPLPEETLRASLDVSAVFLGAVGDPRADGLPPELRPEAGLLQLRSAVGCFANLRPSRVDQELLALSVLRPEVAKGCDLLIVRELIGGIYYGEPRRRDGDSAINTLTYTEGEVERVARVGFEAARGRRRHVTSIDKANVLEVSQLWRSVVERVAGDYPDVRLDHMFIDRSAMELVTNPGQFDVILTSNMFGDILSDEASALCGSLGLLGSASVGGDVGIYEPVHGPTTGIAGQGIANPIGAIRSGVLMLIHSFGLLDEAKALEDAVTSVLRSGLRTKDLAAGGEYVGSADFAAAVVRELT
jgi:3-isopropylmalate dehydrogenase